MKRTFIGIAIAFVVGILTIIALLAHASRDIPEPDVDDLVVYRPDVSAEDNAFTYFVAATDTFYWPKNYNIVVEYLNGDPLNIQGIEEVIERNREALSLIKRGTECQMCISPEITGFDIYAPYLGHWLNMGRVLATEVRQNRLAGRHGHATDACISLLKFGNLIQQEAEMLIHYLIGIAVLELGMQQARDLARDPETPSQDLKQLSGTLADLGPFSPGLIRAVKGEYNVVANTIDEFAAEKFNWEDYCSLLDTEVPSMLRRKHIRGYFLQPNRTKLAFVTIFRDMIDNAPKDYSAMIFSDIERNFEFGESTMMQFARPNAGGKLLLALFAPAIDVFLERKSRAECDLAATQLLVSIHAYRSNIGVLPERLSDLVPEFIHMVPADPFDGNEFRYSQQKRIIYSVGKNGRDSGGATFLLRGDESDPVRLRRWNAEDAVYEIDKSERTTS